jgi:ribosomal protein L15E
MIKESYISMWNKLPHDVIKVRVARPSVLSASKELLYDYKEGRISWQEFENRFRKEI